jgi:hypothetical protein
MASADLNTVPLLLRSNDVERHIINIDSRFRDNANLTTASNFYFTLPNTIRNVLRIRLTSIEIPNNCYFFTEAKSNVTIRIFYKDAAGNPFAVPLVIPDGNYNAQDIINALTAAKTQIPGLAWLNIQFDAINGHFIFYGNPPGGQKFGVDTTYETLQLPFDYGLGYYLGFEQRLHMSVALTVGSAAIASGTQVVESDFPANFAGDSYILLALNDYNCVNHSFYGNTIKAFAKIIVKDQKNYMSFDDYAGDHIKEIVFPGAQDLKRFRIQLLNAYGRLIDMTNTNFSMSLELLEIKNMNLHAAIRDSLSLRWFGAGNEQNNAYKAPG